MSKVQVDQKTYEMPPREGFTVAHFLTVADVEAILANATRVRKARRDWRLVVSSL